MIARLEIGNAGPQVDKLLKLIVSVDKTLTVVSINKRLINV